MAENITKHYDVRGWEYYLALALTVIGALAVIAMALRVLGVI